jgi:hypothetical protein
MVTGTDTKVSAKVQCYAREPACCLPNPSLSMYFPVASLPHTQRTIVLSTDHAMLRRFVAGGFFKDVVGHPG